MSEAVLDDAIAQIADGLTVDWNAIDKAAPARERDWARSLRVLNDIVNLHREAAVDYEHTTLVSAGPAHPSSASTLARRPHCVTASPGQNSTVPCASPPSSGSSSIGIRSSRLKMRR